MSLFLSLMLFFDFSFSFLSFFFLALPLFLFMVMIPLFWMPLYCLQLPPFILFAMMRFSIFTSQLLLASMSVFPRLPLAYRLPSHYHCSIHICCITTCFMTKILFVWFCRESLPLSSKQIRIWVFPQLHLWHASGGPIHLLLLLDKTPS